MYIIQIGGVFGAQALGSALVVHFDIVVVMIGVRSIASLVPKTCKSKRTTKAAPSDTAGKLHN